jgi:xylitol oxidase
MGRTNWAGNYTYRARRLHRPSTLEQVQEIVASASRLRVLGSRHSFTDIGDSSELLTLDGLPPEVVFDKAARTVSFTPRLTYGALAETLRGEEMALANLASLPHISVAGAVATATHGSGNASGNLATAVAAMELVTSDGEVMGVSRSDADFNGLVVGLGALGVVTRITLDIEPSYQVRQRAFEGLSWEALFEQLDAITSSGYSVSVFTRWGEMVDQVWVKNRVTDAPEPVHETLFGAVAATVDRHPILGLDPVNCTPQLGVPGLWSERLPHFRMGFTPSSGDEIQSEYLVPRRHAVAAIRAVRALADTIGPLVQVSEIRTIAADELWMSPQYDQDTIGIHFTWLPEQSAIERALIGIEGALAPLEARPHWGKLFLADTKAIADLYERHSDFAALVERTDPRGAVRNEWLETRVLGRARQPPTAGRRRTVR